MSDLVIKEGLTLVERVKDTPPAIGAIEIPLAGFEFVVVKLFAVPVIVTPSCVSEFVINDGLVLVELIKGAPPANEAIEIPLAGFRFF